MRHPLLILFSLAALAAGLVIGACALTRGAYMHQASLAADDLEWLRMEFSLNEPELQRIRQLHQGYLPQCRDYCERISARNQELDGLLAGTNGVTEGVARKIAEIAALRAECQTGMLRHFQEVSEAMPPAQGQRYFAEMKRLTLGQHHQLERSMSVESTDHGHH